MRFILLAAHLADLPADGGRAGEGHQIDVRVGDEVTAGLGTAGDDADRALGQTGLVDDLGQQQRVERHLRRRLDHDGATGQQGRDELADDDDLRDVERGDGGDHAHRFADDLVRAVHAVEALVPGRGPGRGEEAVDHHRDAADLSDLGEEQR
jgi:hypothetical protein